MARFAWSVDGHRIEFLGRAALLVRGGLRIDGTLDETCRVKAARPDGIVAALVGLLLIRASQ